MDKKVKAIAYRPKDAGIFNRQGRNKAWFIVLDPSELDFTDILLKSMFTEIAVVNSNGLVEDFDNYRNLIQPYLEAQGCQTNNPLSDLKTYKTRSQMIGHHPLHDNSLEEYFDSAKERLGKRYDRIIRYQPNVDIEPDKDVVYSIPIVDAELHNAIPDTARVCVKDHNRISALLSLREYNDFLHNLGDNAASLKKPTVWIWDKEETPYEAYEATPIQELVYLDGVSNKQTYATHRITGEIVEVTPKLSNRGTTARNVNVIASEYVAKHIDGSRYVYSYNSFIQDYRMSLKSEIEAHVTDMTKNKTPQNLAQLFQSAAETFKGTPEVTIKFNTGDYGKETATLLRKDFIRLARAMNRIPKVSEVSKIGKNYIYLPVDDAKELIKKFEANLHPETKEPFEVNVIDNRKEPLPAAAKLSLPFDEHWLHHKSQQPGSKVKYMGQDAIYIGRTRGDEALILARSLSDNSKHYFRTEDVSNKEGDCIVVGGNSYIEEHRLAHPKGLTEFVVNDVSMFVDTQEAYLRMGPPDEKLSIFCSSKSCDNIAAETRVVAKSREREQAKGNQPTRGEKEVNLIKDEAPVCTKHSSKKNQSNMQMALDFGAFPDVSPKEENMVKAQGQTAR